MECVTKICSKVMTSGTVVRFHSNVLHDSIILQVDTLRRALHCVHSSN
jgi:hypothetical protein